jgi:hypothetical protein
MLVVSDIEDVFLPKPNDLLVNIAESRASLEALLGRIGDMFQDNSIMGSAMGPALQAGFKLMVGISGYPYYFIDWMGCAGTYWWKNRCPVFGSPFCGSRLIEKQRRPQNLGYFQGKLCCISYLIFIVINGFRNLDYSKLRHRFTRLLPSSAQERRSQWTCSSSVLLTKT